MKTTIAFACSFVFLAQARADIPLTAPTVTQVYPYLATVCLNDRPVNSYGATGIDDNGNLTGVASFQGFICKLRAHAGRGSGIRIFSGCADVVWDQAGTLISVTPTDYDTNYTIVCQ